MGSGFDLDPHDLFLLQFSQIPDPKHPSRPTVHAHMNAMPAAKPLGQS
jgi:hypothetical protein